MHVVVVGGGFGGVKTALELSKRQIGKITLISDESYFLHHATLYATATGKDFAESLIPLNVIFANHPNVEIIKDRVTRLDSRRRLISSDKKDYHYDKLVLALGSVTTFFGIQGMQEHAYGIKTLDEVRKFHDHIHQEVVEKKLDKEYFVIGAGPTGIELAGALHEYLRSLKSIYRLKNARSTVTLVEAAPQIVPRMSKTAANKVSAALKKQGIKVLTNHKVGALEDDAITIDGKKRPTTTAVWTSGVANNGFFKNNADQFNLAPNGRVNVNPFLEATKDIYVVGDNNTVKYSGMAWPALKQATHVAKNITRLATKRDQKAFRPRPVPTGLPVGEDWGYVEWYGIYVAGRSGAIVRRWMELYGYAQLVPYKTALAVWRAHNISEVDA
jgi:NADH dehydrogenase